MKDRPDKRKQSDWLVLSRKSILVKISTWNRGEKSVTGKYKLQCKQKMWRGHIEGVSGGLQKGDELELKKAEDESLHTDTGIMQTDYFSKAFTFLRYKMKGIVANPEHTHGRNIPSSPFPLLMLKRKLWVEVHAYESRICEQR